jgi:glycosyltransferase involved in cell wall biosynthesis
VTSVLELYRGGWHGGTAAYLATLLPAVAGEFRPIYAAPPGDPGLERLSALGVAVEAIEPSRLAAAARRLGIGLVHSHGVRAGRAGHEVARALAVPRIHTYHSRLAQDYTDPARAFVAGLADRANLRRADLLIAVSEAVAADLRARGAPADRIRVVESGVSAPPATPDRAALRADLGLAPDGPVVGTLARHHPVKGLDVLLRALAEVPNAEACLLGAGPETDNLKRLAEDLGVADRVRWAGYRPDGRACLAVFDLFVLPSRAEGFGLAALEAMAAAVPVVATAVGHLPTLLADGAGRLVPPEDPGALAAAMRALLADDAARRQMAERGRARYAAAYTQAAMAERTRQVWREALAVRAVPPTAMER